VAGLGLAGITPTALSLAGSAFPDAPGTASGVTLTVGYLGVALIPFAGGVASIASVRVVLMVEVLFGCVVVLTSMHLNRWVQGIERFATESEAR